MVTIEVPQEYGYVLLSTISTFFVASWLGTRVTPFRKAAKIPYPHEYASAEQIESIKASDPDLAEKRLIFNAAQRGHQNFNENHPSFVGALLIAGLRYPVTSAVLGGVWSVNRVLYGWGYTRGYKTGLKNGSGRYYGALWMLCQYVVLGMGAKAAWDLAMQ